MFPIKHLPIVRPDKMPDDDLITYFRTNTMENPCIAVLQATGLEKT